MKNFLLRLVIIASIFSACKKSNDYVFDQSPDERINAALASYQSALSGAANGWKAFLTVKGDTGGTYSFYFKFGNDNRVKMFSDFDFTSAQTLQESSYRLKAEQQPTLIFDTYSYVHVLADPNEGTINLQADINGGPVGEGLLSDFEFIFDNEKVKTDTIELAGKVNHSILKLVKATKAEEDAFVAGGLAPGLHIYDILTYFKRLTIGSQLYDMRIDRVNRLLTFNWLDVNGNIKSFTTGYYFTLGGIVFTTPLINGTQTIAGVSNLVWDQAAETITLTAAGNTSATISGTVFPLKVDLAAPVNWYTFALTDQVFYSISYNGFHVNGVNDAYKLSSIPNFFFLIYLPQFGTAGTVSYDLLGYGFLANHSISLGYGSAFKAPVLTADGRIIFSFLGTLGTVPAAYSSIILNTRTKMANPSGFYFVETGVNKWDMISAFDGKSWITWEPHQ